jgi:hypothetical protein
VPAPAKGEDDMRLRRSTAMLAGTLLLALPLSACSINGMNAATNRVYTPAAGSNVHDATVDVLGAVVVSAQKGSGTFIATFVNNHPNNDATVSGFASAPDSPQLTVKDFSPITIPAQGIHNLAAEGNQGIVVTGDFEAGQFVGVQVTFGDGQSVDLDVPVLPDGAEYSNGYEGLDISGSS